MQLGHTIWGEDDFPSTIHLGVDYTSMVGVVEGAADHSDLALEAAQAKRKCAEAANSQLLRADLNVGRIHMERKKDGIAAFTHSEFMATCITLSSLSHLSASQDVSRMISACYFQNQDEEIELERVQVDVVVEYFYIVMRTVRPSKRLQNHGGGRRVVGEKNEAFEWLQNHTNGLRRQEGSRGGERGLRMTAKPYKRLEHHLNFQAAEAGGGRRVVGEENGVFKRLQNHTNGSRRQEGSRRGGQGLRTPAKPYKRLKHHLNFQAAEAGG
ncbi:hypothetical protein DFH29DRAFT_878938 [Suillus ampliporus]|nr:hypothetical protein DFH29DRAFT_878938 [Suillus ampliporus]